MTANAPNRCKAAPAASAPVCSSLSASQRCQRACAAPAELQQLATFCRTRPGRELSVDFFYFKASLACVSAILGSREGGPMLRGALGQSKACNHWQNGDNWEGIVQGKPSREQWGVVKAASVVMGREVSWTDRSAARRRAGTDVGEIVGRCQRGAQGNGAPLAGRQGRGAGAACCAAPQVHQGIGECALRERSRRSGVSCMLRQALVRPGVCYTRTCTRAGWKRSKT